MVKQDLREPLSEAALKNTPYPDYGKYKITGEGVTFTVNGKTFPALDGTGDTFFIEIDSGSVPVFAAKSVIEEIAAALDPPFKYDSKRDANSLFGPCNTILKDMTLNIGGVSLPISKDSLMYTTTDVPGPPLPSESNGKSDRHARPAMECLPDIIQTSVLLHSIQTTPSTTKTTCSLAPAS